MTPLNVMTGLLASSALAALFLGTYAWKSYHSNYGKTVTFLCLATAVYACGYCLELRAVNLEEALRWNRVQYLAIPFIAPLWALMALEFRGYHRRASWLQSGFLFLIPALTVLIRWIPSLSSLHYAEVTQVSTGLFNALQISRGPWYLVTAGHTVAVVAYAVIQHWRVANRATGIIKRQAVILMLASAVPFSFFLLLVTNRTPHGLDLVPVGLVISVALVMLGFTRYRMLSVVHLAQENVFEWSPDGLLILDAEHALVGFNSAAVAVFPELNAPIRGKDVDEVLSQYPQLLGTIREGRLDTELELEQGDRLRFYQVRIKQLHDTVGNVIGHLVALADRTEQVLLLRQVERVAAMDEMTGVYNRRHALDLIEATLHQAMGEKRPFSLLMLDLDHFKRVNDEYGHLVGDEVLRQVAALCILHTRPDDIVGRFGGEEFVIGLTDTSLDNAFRVAERIRSAVAEEALHVGELALQLTVSIGVYGLEAGYGKELETLLQLADGALYHAKRSGRNLVCIGGKEDTLPRVSEDVS